MNTYEIWVGNIPMIVHADFTQTSDRGSGQTFFYKNGEIMTPVAIAPAGALIILKNIG